jgi:hypothetical protein
MRKSPQGGGSLQGRTIPIAIGCVLAGAALVPAGVAGAGTLLSVFVANDSSHPVPTQAIGTTKVDGAVTVANGAERPVPVAVQTGTPYQKQSTIRVRNTFGASTEFLAVPAGKDLVIEHISAGAESSSPIAELRVFAYNATETIGEEHLPIFAAPANDKLGYDDFAASVDTQLRAPDLYRASVRMTTVPSAGATVLVTVMGRLVAEEPISG